MRIEECQTQDLWLTELGKRVEDILRELRLEGFHPGRRRGVAKAFWARLASGTGEVLAGLVTRPGPFAEGARFAELLESAAGELPQRGRPRRLVGVMHSISDRDDDFLLGDRHVPLRGRDHVVDVRDGSRRSRRRRRGEVPRHAQTRGRGETRIGRHERSRTIDDRSGVPRGDPGDPGDPGGSTTRRRVVRRR